MLPSIILFLALLSTLIASFVIIKIFLQYLVQENEIDLSKEVLVSFIPILLWSILFYLFH